MMRNMRNLSLAFGQLDGRYVRLGLAVMTLALFVLGGIAMHQYAGNRGIVTRCFGRGSEAFRRMLPI